MPTGNTVTDSLADSLPTVIASARIVREFDAKMPNLVSKVTLAQNTGLTWHEVDLAQLLAQAVTETTELDNPQQLSDTLFSITPTVVGIQTLITDRVAQRISANAFANTGGLAQNAMERKKDEDGLTVLDGATTSLAGTGTTLTSGHITAATYRITGNVTEPSSNSPIRCVLHGFQIKDIEDELTAALGTYEITQGVTQRAIASMFRGQISNAQIFEDGNITIDATPDAKGGVFSQEAIVLVQGFSPRSEMRREPHIGGGATSMFLYDEYAYGERSSGNWLYELFSDATAPTS